MKYKDMTQKQKDTRIEALTRLTRTAGSLGMLPEVCLYLRMSLNGSSDFMSDEVIQKTLRDLKTVRDLWVDSDPKIMGVPSHQMDLAVFDLIFWTIRYAEQRIALKDQENLEIKVDWF